MVNFGELVLACIEDDVLQMKTHLIIYFCNIFESTRLTHFITAPDSTILQFDNIFKKNDRHLSNFVNFIITFDDIL